MDTDGDWVYVPAPPDTRTYTDLGRIAVDGETFDVHRSEDDGAVHYAWVSGPNAGYGFSVLGSSAPHAHERQTAEIRDFLSGIDPATGFLADP